DSHPVPVLLLLRCKAQHELFHAADLEAAHQVEDPQDPRFSGRRGCGELIRPISGSSGRPLQNGHCGASDDASNLTVPRDSTGRNLLPCSIRMSGPISSCTRISSPSVRARISFKLEQSSFENVSSVAIRTMSWSRCS